MTRVHPAASVGRAVQAFLVLVLNELNLNLLGRCQPQICGHKTPADVKRDCRALDSALA